MAVPGSIVGIGKLITPGGQQGPAGSGGGAGTPGTPAWTVTTSSFIVPPVNSTAVVSVSDSTWAAVGEFVWVATAGGSVNVPMALQVTAKTSSSLTLLNPPTAGTQPSGDAGNLITTGSDSLLYLPPSAVQNAVQPTIGAASLRNFNALGNSTFEVDTRTCGVGVSGATSGFALDRWNVGRSGTMVIPAKQTAGRVNFPGTNFAISQNFLRFTVTTQEVSLAASDQYYLLAYPEGIVLRELINDTHSVGILCRSSVANLSFSIAMTDSSSAWSLAHLCSLGAANTWTWIPWTAIPNFTANATWNTTPGSLGYYFYIMLAAGSNYLTAPDIWTSGWKIAATGMSNFAAQAVNSTFDIAFVQHQPGNVLAPVDKSFSQNLDESLRYYYKSYDIGVLPGAATSIGCALVQSYPNQSAYGVFRYQKPMAKIPTITIYNVNGSVNSVHDGPGGIERTVSGVTNIGISGHSGPTLSTVNAANTYYTFQYTADTFW